MSMRRIFILSCALTVISGPTFGDVCVVYRDDASAYQRCLAQNYQYWQQRVRVSVDKAMIAAADKDGANGYGLHVRLLDGEQNAWERASEKACGFVEVVADAQPKNLACWISRLQERYEAISRK